MAARLGFRRRGAAAATALATLLVASCSVAPAVAPVAPERTAGDRAAGEPAAGVRLTYLATATLPAGTTFEGTCVGGLSALTGGADGRYWSPSDSRLDARLYGLRIAVVEAADGSAAAPELNMTVESVARLHSREGEPYGERRIDPEGLAWVRPGAAWLSTDGVTTEGVAPAIDLVDLATGEWLMSAPVPESFRPRSTPAGSVGIRYNLGFEALTLTPDGRFLIAGTEAALEQDPAPDIAGATSHARLLVYRLDETPHLVGQALYPLDRPAGDLVVHGLSELLALDDDGRFLALERTFLRDRGFVNRVFELRLPSPPSDLAAGDEPAAPLPVVKRLVADFADLGLPLQNYEALAFGPRLRGGAETLLVLADNDKPSCPPRADHIPILPSRLLLFRLERGSP